MRNLGVSCLKFLVCLPRHAVGPRSISETPVRASRISMSSNEARDFSVASEIIRVKTPSQSAGVYKAKQSLGQNFLVDPNIANRIVSSLEDSSEGGKCVVEVGPGKGSLTALLLNKYPHMKAVEIDQRSVEYLNAQLPTLKVLHRSVLDVDWAALSQEAGGEQLSVIGNLPYYITSQILFSIMDAAPHVRRAVVTMQLEVAQRVCAGPGSRTYGIVSVAAQLFARPRILFQIPPSAFQPRPDVQSALVCLDFPPARPDLGVNEKHLRSVLRAAFQQRRKMLRQSLKSLDPILAQRAAGPAAAAAAASGGAAAATSVAAAMPESWGTRRPEQLSPQEFVELTKALFGPGRTPPGAAVWRGNVAELTRD